MTEELQKKVDRAIRLIQAGARAAERHGQPLEICYSGGKDSDVILELAKMSGVNYRAIYKNTTIDPPGTIKHVRERGVEVMQPKMTFRQLLAKKGLPGRNRRFCCEHLKEYKILDYAVIGVRRDESDTRAQYEEPTVCMDYKKDESAELYMPLLDFTAKDIEAFIMERGIRCHPLYYDEKGRFHVERRLGCIGCPLAYRKHRIQEFKQTPGMVRLYVHAAQQFLDSHPQSKMFAYLKDASDWFAMSLYCDSIADFKRKFGATLLTPPHRLQEVPGGRVRHQAMNEFLI